MINFLETSNKSSQTIRIMKEVSKFAKYKINLGKLITFPYMDI